MTGGRFVEYLEGQSRSDQTARKPGATDWQWVPPDFAGQVDNHAVDGGSQQSAPHRANISDFDTYRWPERLL